MKDEECVNYREKRIKIFVHGLLTIVGGVIAATGVESENVELRIVGFVLLGASFAVLLDTVLEYVLRHKPTLESWNALNTDDFRIVYHYYYSSQSESGDHWRHIRLDFASRRKGSRLCQNYTIDDPTSEATVTLTYDLEMRTRGHQIVVYITPLNSGDSAIALFPLKASYVKESPLSGVHSNINFFGKVRINRAILSQSELCDTSNCEFGKIDSKDTIDNLDRIWREGESVEELISSGKE